MLQRRCVTGSKSGKRPEAAARLSYGQACEFGFRGSLDEWERLMARSLIGSAV